MKLLANIFAAKGVSLLRKSTEPTGTFLIKT
jgi:hypothetical protein